MERDTKGKFAKKKWYKRWSLWVVVACVVIMGGGHFTGDYEFIADWIAPEAVYKAEAMEIVSEVPTEKALAAMKHDLLKTLQLCESAGKEGEAAYELVTFDPDRSGKVSQIPSFGQFQYKVDTMKGYWKKMTGEVLTTRQAQGHGQDGEQSWKTTDYVIFTLDIAPSTDWYHCSVKHDLYKTAAYINKYDK